MNPIHYAGYVIVPLHLVAGFLFALLPASPYQQGYSATYGAIALLPFFLRDFSDAWHAIVYPLILGGSLLACLVVGHLTVMISRR
ncbi:MAG: hypothetical protein ACFCUT_19345 [Kiloniellaceae bacterium]